MVFVVQIWGWWKMRDLDSPSGDWRLRRRYNTNVRDEVYFTRSEEGSRDSVGKNWGLAGWGDEQYISVMLRTASVYLVASSYSSFQPSRAHCSRRWVTQQPWSGVTASSYFLTPLVCNKVQRPPLGDTSVCHLPGVCGCV